jgi:hypothetical protein
MCEQVVGVPDSLRAELRTQTSTSLHEVLQHEVAGLCELFTCVDVFVFVVLLGRLHVRVLVYLAV